MIEQYLKGLKVPKDELTAIERNKLLNEGKDVASSIPSLAISSKRPTKGDTYVAPALAANNA